MFPKPQCPICGMTFDTLGEALQHLDAQTCQLPLHPQSTLPLHSENRDSVPVYEVEDPLTRTVEEAG